MLGVEGGGESCNRRHHPGRLDSRCVQDRHRGEDSSQLQQRRGHPGEDGAHESDTGPPFQRAGTPTDAAKSGRAGAPMLGPAAPAEPEYGEDDLERQRGHRHHGQPCPVRTGDSLRDCLLCGDDAAGCSLAVPTGAPVECSFAAGDWPFIRR